MARKMTKNSKIEYAICKVEELTTDQIFNNFIIGEIVSYKEICNRLHLESKKGNQKTLQLKELQRYLEVEKIKSKFLITDIFNEKKPLEPRDPAGNAIYVKYIECVLLQYLSSVPGNQTYITKSNLWQLLGITNHKYSKYKYKTELIKKEYPILTYFELNNFYQRSWSFIDKVVERSLDSLDRRALIRYQKNVDIIVERADNGQEIHRRATPNEIEELLKIKRSVLLMFDLEDEKQIRYLDLKKRKSFYDTIDNILYNKHNWLRTYTTYHLIYNRENAKEALSRDRVELEKLTLNEIVIQKINTQAQNTFDKNRDKVVENFYNDKPLGFCYPDWYVEVQEKISELLLRIEDKRKKDLENEVEIIIPDSN